MMPKPRDMSGKNKSQGFHLFLLEFIEDENLIKVNSSFEAVRIKGNTVWNNLSKEKREEYRKRAEKEGSEEIDNRLKAVNDQFNLLERQSKNKELDSREKIKSFLKTTFKSSTWNSQVFIIGHANYLAKVKNDYYVKEVGIAKYSIEEGLISSLHFHLNSGKLPIGHENEAQCRAENSHQLPINQNFGINLSEANEKIGKFLDVKNENFIFTLYEDKDMEAMKYVMNQITNEDFHVISLESLLTNYYEVINEVDMSMKDAHCMLLEKNPWESWDIGCEYHKKKDASKFCSHAKAKRWAYHISKILLPEQLLYPGIYTPPLYN